ncbi:MAG: DALR domain-containing protein, partial [Clostridia bacterium]
MDDDLNTADAIGSLFEMVKEANIALQSGCACEVVEQVQTYLDEMTGVLGIMKPKNQEDLDEQIQRMVEERALARKEKNWKEADRLRDAIKAHGYILEDTPQGQKVRKENETKPVASGVILH